MRTAIPNGPAAAIAAMAETQHGVAGRQQLLGLGLSPDAIGRMVRSGHLWPVFRGVYAVGHRALSREGWWMAALIAGGDGAVLSHTSAAAKWRLLAPPTFPIHVTVTGDRGRNQPRISAHRMRLAPTEVAVVDGLRVTTPARAIVDVAATTSPRALREIVERAQDLRRFRPNAIRECLASRPRRPGVRCLRDLLRLMEPDADGARSYLEQLFSRIIRVAGLPRPEVNVTVRGGRRDFVWPDHRLVVEVDGYRWHSSRAAMRRDRYRDRELTAAGWRAVRFTYEDVAFDAAQVAGELAALLRADRPLGIYMRHTHTSPQRSPCGRPRGAAGVPPGPFYHRLHLRW